MPVLAIETAGSRGGVALLCEPDHVFEATFYMPRKHVELLPSCVSSVLRAAGVKEPSLIAVDVGPGSFTGLRIGVAFAKAFAQARAIPLVGVRQTEVVGLPVAAWWPGRVAVWIHDRRGIVYHAWASQGKVGRESVLEVEEAVGKLRGRGDVLLVGTGALRFRELVKRKAPGVVVAGPALAHPTPAEVARQGLARFEAQGPDRLFQLEPVYIQPPLSSKED
ncbi:tRNA (adenosine(37)-N6)-threonylcarbamoyltransferase complex dimerization subunit type 1 TsaB [Candidatus Bipolaricaulota bacterium]|nr:tRNA (adenosine(37)-N6)-threonylcarbamoyltransferase complex dimerization subunit type 1 TsaB [Candidatus Bipolaricaulota bacterium]